MERFVIIDNGHGIDTPGKRSPDGRVLEWQWTRRCARQLAALLAGRGIASALLSPSEADMPLAQRCRLANALANGHPGAILVSLHSNASGDGTVWGNASGWSVFVAPHASARSLRLAACLFEQAHRRNLLGNRHTPAELCHRARFAICTATRCPAVLTENMFHDNRADAAFLASDEGVATIAALHADAIEAYYTTEP